MKNAEHGARQGDLCTRDFSAGMGLGGYAK